MSIWFEDWLSILNILIRGGFCFVALIIMLRISGKRTLTKMNAFDFIVTVTMGSTLATAITSEMPITEGIAALGILIFIQFIIAWLSVRIPWFQKLVKATPSVLFDAGEFKNKTLYRERITKLEVLAAMRLQGFSDPSQVQLVLLETDGRLSVISKADDIKEPGVMKSVGTFNSKIEN